MALDVTGAKLLLVADLNLFLRYPNLKHGRLFPHGSLAYLFVQMHSKMLHGKTKTKNVKSRKQTEQLHNVYRVRGRFEIQKRLSHEYTPTPFGMAISHFGQPPLNGRFIIFVAQ